MQAAVIFGPGCSLKTLRPFQPDIGIQVEWHIGLPAATADAEVVLLFGGDGTIHRHLAPLVKLGLPVLVVPAGSGNDFARALGLRRRSDSLSAWRRFCKHRNNVRTIDLGVITALNSETISSETTSPGGVAPQTANPSRYFCSVGGIGLDAEVARRANRLPRWLRGHGGYALSLVPAAFRFAPVRVKILASDVDLAAHADRPFSWTVRSRQPTILVAFANTPLYGGGLEIAPRAQPDDGLLDVCTVTEINKFKLFFLFPTVYFGRHLNRPEVNYFQTTRLRVETENPLPVYADGEYVCRTPVEISIQSLALKVLTI